MYYELFYLQQFFNLHKKLQLHTNYCFVKLKNQFQDFLFF